MKTNIVQTTTKDKLILSGLFKEGDTPKSAVILVHGFTSDFYSHKFFHSIQEKLESNGIASVAIQNRGTGMHTEFLLEGRKESEWIGSFYEKIEEAHLDISAWIEFLKNKGYSAITLLGHSLGTIKTVRYLFEGTYSDQINNIVLLAPFDKNGFIENYTEGKWKEYVKTAQKEIDNGEGRKIIPEHFEDFPMSYTNFVSWYQDSELNNMWDFYRGDNYNFPILNKIEIPTLILVGDKDEFFYIPQFSTLESVRKILLNNISNLDLHILKGANHTYVGFENIVSELVKKYLL